MEIKKLISCDCEGVDNTPLNLKAHCTEMIAAKPNWNIISKW